MEENSAPSDGTDVPPTPSGRDGQPAGLDGPSPLERLASFRFTYVAIFVFLILYVFSVEGAEAILQRHFENELRTITSAAPVEGPVIPEIQARVDRLMRRSFWTRWGGVRVTPIVLGADGRTLIYAGGGPVPPPPPLGGSLGSTRDYDLLPASVDVVLSIPHNALLANAILVTYFGILVATLLAYTRSLTRREEAQMNAVRISRDEVANRARGIESELEAVRGRLAKVEPERESYAGEIRELEEERRRLHAQLTEVEAREATLRSGTQQTRALEEERTALEELLEEAQTDLEQKEGEIQALQRQVKKAGRREPSSRSREAEHLARRLTSLYKNLELDDRAIQDLAAIREEAMKLKAELALKNLAEESDQAAVRRKVGGLPNHLSIFELGFAGKGRIYYTRGRQRRFRILAVGGKASQKTDLEYLSRLPREG